MHIPAKKLNPQAILPLYQTAEAAGADLHACLDDIITIKPGAVEIVPTGIAIELPAGYEAQVRSRSGLAAKHSIAVLNSPGTVDSDYRGEVKVILINHGQNDFIINHGDRIAQMVIAKHETATIEEVEELGSSDRGEGGFGSTGATR